MKRLLVFVFVLLPISVLWADENAGNNNIDKDYAEALDYLKKMRLALNNLNYHGTLVYLHNGQVETIELIHKKDQFGEHERLVHLSGAAREVVRDGDMVTCYLPDSQSVVKSKRRSNNHLLAKLKANFKDFIDYYSFEINGNDRVAGRSTKIILVNPKDEYRYGYRLWIDVESNLLLKSALVNAQEQVLEQMMFANITIVDSIPDEMLKPAINGEKFTWHNGKHNEEKPGLVKTHWKVNQMPTGFSVTGYFKQAMPNGGLPADHLIVSDGLASISIYVESFGAESQSFVGASSMGAMHIFGSIIEDYKITVVGEVPELTVRTIANSLQYQADGISVPAAMAGEGG